MAQKNSTIPKGWKITTLGEVAEIRNGKTRPKDGNKYPVYGGNGVLGFANEYNVDGYMIIAGRVGAYCGSIFFEREKFWLSDNALGILAKEKSNINFLYYLLKKINLNKQAIGGAQPLLTQGIINQIEVLVPVDKSEQRAIAAVLSSLDDKIELLREQNKTLEATAQTIFKEWFVNFNFPDDEDNPYKSNGGEMVESELGKIPKDWRVGRLGEILSLEYGKALKEENRTGKGYPVFGSNGIVGFHDKFLVKGDGIVVGRKGTMGSVIWAENNFYPIDTAFFVKDKLDVDKLFFHYLLLLRQNFEKIGSDSAVPGLNRNSVNAIETVIPKIKIINYFHQTIGPVFSKIRLNNSQIQTLSSLRDTLLPKLMKGEVRVKENI